MFCTKRRSSRFCKFHRKTPALESPWSFFWKKLQPEGLQFYLKKGSNSFFPVKFAKLLRAPDFKEHLLTTACEFKPVRCIVFIKAMANITSRGKVSFNCHLLFHYSWFNSTIIRNPFHCSTVNNSYRKLEKPLLCYAVKWNLASTLTYFANTSCSWSSSAQLFSVSQEPLEV